VKGRIAALEDEIARIMAPDSKDMEIEPRRRVQFFGQDSLPCRWMTSGQPSERFGGIRKPFNWKK
jgi:hypothetical protein